jgi:hypothetical protein
MREKVVQLLSGETGCACEGPSFRDSFAEGDRKDRGHDMGVEWVELGRACFDEEEVEVLWEKGGGPLTPALSREGRASVFEVKHV